MNVYLLTNLISGARALVCARVEHEARYRRPDGATWRLGHWHDPQRHRVAPSLEWWPGTPDDIDAEPVMQDIDVDSSALHCSPVMATKSPRRSPRQRPETRALSTSRPRPPERRPVQPSFTTAARPRPRRAPSEPSV
ncbi:MAG: hypothetical protein AAGF11_25340 [Myxococcota bacterium]